MGTAWRKQNESGLILISVLWVVAILSLIAIGLSQRLSVDLELVKYKLGNFRAGYAAKSAVPYVFNLLVDEQRGEKIDFQSPCGHFMDEDEQKRLLDNVDVSDHAAFSLVYDQETSGFALWDERARVNLNAIKSNNHLIFARLLEIVSDIDEDTAEEMALAVLDWVDRDNQTSATVDAEGAEQAEYDKESRPVKVKNRPLDSIFELSMVAGFSDEIVTAIEPFVTVFPKYEQQTPGFNINMVRPELLKAIALSFPKTDEQTVDAVIDMLVQYRLGVDETLCTEDDRVIVDSGNNVEDQLNILDRLSSSEEAIYRNLTTFHIAQDPLYIKILALGKDTQFDIEQYREIIVKTEDNTVVFDRIFE